MSSRQEEKERRKAEREAAEAAAARSAANKGRLQLALGGLVAIAVIAIAVLVFTRSTDGGDSTSASSPSDAANVSLPEPKETNLRAAAEAANCELATTESEGRDHTEDTVEYKTNPPTSGPHNPVAAQDGLYEAGNAPPIGMHVHSLEHGRIDIQYKKGSPKATIDALETVGSEALQFGTEGYHVLVFENNTDMEPAVAATAWTQSLTCPELNDQVYDAIRTFRTEYTDKGPELIP